MLKTEVRQNHFGTPEEIASLATWLCSPSAALATGGAYVVDGGQTRSIESHYSPVATLLNTNQPGYSDCADPCSVFCGFVS